MLVVSCMSGVGGAPAVRQTNPLLHKIPSRGASALRVDVERPNLFVGTTLQPAT